MLDRKEISLRRDRVKYVVSCSEARMTLTSARADMLAVRVAL